jgi:hypothetical protein
MILPSILEFDVHGSFSGKKHPLILEVPASPEFLPAIVSSSRPFKFIVNRSITKENRIRTGVFKYAEENVDLLLSDMFEAAYQLSVDENYDNILLSPNLALKYIKDSSGLKSQPHGCLVPDSFSSEEFSRVFGIPPDSTDYNGVKLIRCNVKRVTFLSRPDFVGLYTRFMNEAISIILHNVRLGVSFVK